MTSSLLVATPDAATRSPSGSTHGAATLPVESGRGPCDHHHATVLAASGSSFDDHTFAFLRCACGAWVARTDWKAGGIEERPMTAEEIAEWGPIADGPLFDDGSDNDSEFD